MYPVILTATEHRWLVEVVRRVARRRRSEIATTVLQQLEAAVRIDELRELRR